jgi:hypothetical protein
MQIHIHLKILKDYLIILLYNKMNKQEKNILYQREYYLKNKEKHLAYIWHKNVNVNFVEDQ